MMFAKRVFIFILMRRSFVWSWLPMQAAIALASEPPRYVCRTWQMDEGLPQNSVQALAQTAEGYLWVGTTHGLARFDGMHFTVFDADNTPAIKNSSITALRRTRDGALWVGTGGGLAEFARGHFTQQSLGDDARANNVKCIFEGHDGALWVGTVGGLFCQRDGKWTHYTTKDGLSENLVRSVCEEGEQLWIGTGGGLDVCKAGVITKRPLPFRSPNPSVREVLYDSKKRLWVGFVGGLGCLEDGQFTYFSRKNGLPDDTVAALAEDDHGNLWIGTYGGLCRLTDDRIVVEKDATGGFYDQINALLQDQEGDVWAGARDGLQELRTRRFLSYTRREGMPHDNIMSVMEDREGRLWFGTWGGGLAEMKDDRITRFTWENSLKDGLSTDLILSLGEDADGDLLMGADYEGGAFRYDGSKFTRIWEKEESLTNRVVRVIYRDREGDLWFGTSSGLVQANSNEKFLAQLTIRSIAQDKDGILWVGTSNGLFARRNGKFERASLPTAMEHETVTALRTDDEGTLWVGSARHGLGRWKDGHYTGYTTRQGLWSNEIFEILEDAHGWLWMSSPKGIFRVSKANLAAHDRGEALTLNAIAYGKADGLESIQCNGVAKPAGWKGRDGRLWFATTKGVVVTDPNAAEESIQRAPTVRIEEVIADQHPLETGDENEPHLRAGPGRGELEFHYTALSLSAPEKTRFRYKLAGVDPDWVEAAGRRVAYYNNLPPGDYDFSVMAANNDGLWNSAGASVNVKLQPHFWQLWWFTGCAAVAMAGTIGATVRYATRKRLARRLQRLEEQHAIERERTRIARDMHDDLGARLTEILLLNELAQKTNPEKLQDHLGKQANAIQEAAGSLDAIVWAVNPVNDSLDRLANYLCEQVERLLTMRSIRCRFDVPAQLPEYSVPSEIRHNVFLAVREALNNVIKHSGATETWFRLRTTADTLAIIIEDNGRGFLAGDKARPGNGLENMEKRMKSIGGAFQLVTTPGGGTSIHLEVPIQTHSKK